MLHPTTSTLYIQLLSFESCLSLITEIHIRRLHEPGTTTLEKCHRASSLAPCLMKSASSRPWCVPRPPQVFHILAAIQVNVQSDQVHFRILVLTVSETPMKSVVQSKFHVYFFEGIIIQGFPLSAIHSLEDGFVSAR